MSPTPSLESPSRAAESGRDHGPRAVHARGLRLAFAGGGTGGHIVPGLHLLSWMREARRPALDVVWFTSGRAVEERVLGNVGSVLGGTPFERVRLAIEPVGGGAPTRARLLFRAPGGVLAARAALVRHRPDVLVGLGGFTCLPPVLAARSLGIPVVLLEINAHRGAATRWLSRFAARVLHAWRATMTSGETAVDRFVGPPLGPEFLARDGLDAAELARERANARAALGFDADRPLVLVLGGSQGSSALNAFARTHAPRLVAEGLSVLHQTGPGKLRESAAEFRGYRALEYVDPMRPALAAATVCLARGGASTLAEIAAMRVPAFVAPYPGHRDRHQERNAAELGPGVRIVQDVDLDVRARDELIALAGPGGEAERRRMSAHLRSTVPLDAARAIWTELCSVSRS